MKRITVFRISSTVTLALSLMLSLPVFSQAACQSEQYQQFDFWLGEWTVTTPNGKLAGHNSITKGHNGCTLKESYNTPTGYQGNSFNIFDRQSGHWHQTWVDNSGLLLQLDGQLEEGSMVLSGKGKLPSGESIIHRITWTPNPEGTVRQHWQTSKDQGANWSTAFDGLYTKKHPETKE